MHPDDNLVPDPAAVSAALAAPFAGLNIADSIERLNTLDVDDAVEVALALPPLRLIDMFDRPELSRASELIALLPVDIAARLLDGVADDHAADILMGLDDAVRASVIGELGAGTLASIRELMKYPCGTAGSLMSTEFVSAPSN